MVSPPIHIKCHSTQLKATAALSLAHHNALAAMKDRRQKRIKPTACEKRAMSLVRADHDASLAMKFQFPLVENPVSLESVVTFRPS